MRVFVTGATGFIGSAVVSDLMSAGHKVLGLARSDAAAARLSARGCEAHRGSLEDLDSLRSGAAASDGVIHTAFIHDFSIQNFSKFKDHCETDRRAVEALGSPLAGSDRPLIVTSATALLPKGRLASEDDIPATSIPRVATEQAAAALAERGVRVSVVRHPPTVHGDGDRGFVPLLIELAREKGEAAYVGHGFNRWPATHRSDAAQLYRLALEKGEIGASYHGVAEEGVSFRDIAAVIGRRLNLPVVSKTPEEAPGHFGWFAHFAMLDNPVSSEQTRERLGWHPKGPALIPDLDRPHYFET